MLGYIGPLTESDLAGENGRTYFRSEYIGKAGLEIQYDEFLRGSPGIKTFTVDRKEAVTNTSKVVNPTPGNHLVTSIDVRLQAASEKALAAAVARSRANGFRADGAAAVVMDVVTGRVLALASYPTFDPNAYERGLTVKQASDLYSESQGVPALSRALQGLFAPASTFKAVSLVAAANAGYNLNANYDCPGNLQVGTRLFRNFESKNQGTLSMTKAMAVSCDTIWYKIAFDEWLRDGGLRPKSNANDYFFKAAEGFQVGVKTGIDLPSESSGRLANREWRKSWHEQNRGKYQYANSSRPEQVDADDALDAKPQPEQPKAAPEQQKGMTVKASANAPLPDNDPFNFPTTTPPNHNTQPPIEIEDDLPF
jgi:penicillin-binding protein 2